MIGKWQSLWHDLFSEDVVEPPMIYRQYLDTLAAVPLDAEEDEASGLIGRRVDEGADGSSINLTSQKQIATILEPSDGELVGSALEYASGVEHHGLHNDTCSEHPIFPAQQDCSECFGIQLAALGFPSQRRAGRAICHEAFTRQYHLSLFRRRKARLARGASSYQ